MSRINWSVRVVSVLAMVLNLSTTAVAQSRGGGRGAGHGGSTSHGTGVLSGTVRDASGKPVARVGVSLSEASSLPGAPSPGGNAPFVFSDENGRFSFPHAPSGDLKVSAMALGFPDFSGLVTVTAGQTTTYDVIMRSLVPR